MPVALGLGAGGGAAWRSAAHRLRHNMGAAASQRPPRSELCSCRAADYNSGSPSSSTGCSAPTRTIACCGGVGVCSDILDIRPANVHD